MHPSRPSSSDPNAPYRAAIASLADCNFFADAVTEQHTQSATTPHPPNQFAALGPNGGLTNSHCANVTADIAPPTSVTIDTLRSYLSELGYSGTNLLRDASVHNRLTAAGLTPATLLTALQIVHARRHPLLASLDVDAQQLDDLKNRLAGIVLHSAGFKTRMRNVVADANNDPERLITSVFVYIRDL